MARRLTEEGISDAAALGHRLHKKGIKADIIISSPAVRAETTAQLVAAAINYPENAIVSEKFLYHTYPEEIVAFIRNFDDEVKSLFIVGHNPVLFETVNLLGTEEIDKLRPGQAVKFQFDVASWKDISPDTCKKMKEKF
jgi:phosphohistidine phosphatase